MPSSDEPCCLPGDIRRAGPHGVDLPSAILEARVLERERVRIWFHEKAETYHPILPDDSLDAPPI